MTQPTPVQSYALSSMQLGMLYEYLSAPGAGVGVEQIVGDLAEPVEGDLLRSAWQQVAAGHDVFRTSFDWSRDDPEQHVHAEVELPFTSESWEHLSAEQQEAGLERFLAEDRARGLDLSQAPGMRVALFRRGPARFTMVWTFHHVLLDGRSFAPVLREVFECYAALRDGAPAVLPAGLPYRDYIDWLALRDSSGEEQFWRSALRGFRKSTALPPLPAGNGEGGTAVAELRLSRSATAALKELYDAEGLSLNTLVQGAWGLLLSRYTGETDIVFGAARAGRRGTLPDADSIVGLFIRTLPIRLRVDEDVPLRTLLNRLRDEQRAVRPHEHASLIDVQGWSDVARGTSLFDTILVYDHETLGSSLRKLGGDWERRHFHMLEQTGYGLTLYAYGEPELQLKLGYDAGQFSPAGIRRLLESLRTLLEALPSHLDASITTLPVLPPAERERLLVSLNATADVPPPAACVHEQIQRQAADMPDAIAVVCRGQSITFGDLNARANQLARHLRGVGVEPDAVVGVYMDRSIDMMVALLAVHKAGGAYLPLDPEYPQDRLAFMLEDAGAPVLLTRDHLVAALPAHGAHVIRVDADWAAIAGEDSADLTAGGASPSNLAYLIYTSGSTGRPKGVMVEHRNVTNFFLGMDQRLGNDEADVFLSITSLSFDISVLELFWTLGRGTKVVLYTGDERQAAPLPPEKKRGPEFSLFYFSSDEGEKGSGKYRLLLEGARFADRNGFSAVWTPERHFHAFGGLYPNPSVTGAAIAAVTEHVQIRAGSVVLPLHPPVRVAEEWSVVDNISNGRVGISFAAGWQPNDFVLRPENFANAKQIMLREIQTVRELWRGGSVSLTGPLGKEVEVSTLPRPVQPELPFWMTTAGNPESFRLAGEMGANVLTHLLGQTVEEVRDKLAIYREAWRAAGHPGEGIVSLMLHTFVGTDDESVKEIVREPMKEYLRSSISLIKQHAWSFPAVKRRADAGDGQLDFSKLTDEEMDALLEYSFERYYETSGLFGSIDSCERTVDRMRDIGVDDIACLIDFGVPSDLVLENLQLLADLRERCSYSATDDGSVAALIRNEGVTAMQCTPSMASLLLPDADAREALGHLRQLLVGGEAFPAALADSLREVVNGEIHNMYGPTETTIWSSTHRVTAADDTIPLGEPIANTQLYIVDEHLQPVPVGVPGELLIGGAGVVRGYLNRPELTSERFIPDPFSADPTARLYRTGDVVRRREDDGIDFLGRLDHQVKVRGHRIELGEIETLLGREEGVREAIVITREDSPGDVRLVAYVTAAGEPIDPQALRQLLQQQLPDYMVPARIVVLDSLPRTPNLKVDRRALPAPADMVQATVRHASTPATARTADDAAVAAGANGVGGGSDLERQIAQLWAQVLGVTDVGTQDNFFDLGGHSLLAVQVHGRMRRELGQELSITDLFRFPTVRSLAGFLNRRAESAPAPLAAVGTSSDPTRPLSRAEARRQARQLRTESGA